MVNKYEVTTRDIYGGMTSIVIVEADSFYTDNGNVSFSIGKYGPEYLSPPEVIAYYRDVESVKKLKDE